MQQKLINRRWIYVGFNIGLGLIAAFVAVGLCVALLEIVYVALFVGGAMRLEGILIYLPSLFFYGLGLLLLFYIPALVGQSLAKILNAWNLKRALKAAKESA